jgi:hypothetical protein
MHGGTNPGAPKGNQNGLRHGWYSMAAARLRGKIAAISIAQKLG